MSKKLTHKNTCVYNLGYHLIFCPKFRRRVLVDGVDTRLKEILLEIAAERRYVIETMEIMPDHVHLFIRIPPTISIFDAVNKLKGKSSRLIREEFPWMKKRIPTLWTRSYYVESVGHISEDVVKKYIEDQKKV